MVGDSLDIRGSMAAILVTGALSIAAQAESPAQERDKWGNGQQDFDFEIGTWKTALKRLVKPLSGSTEWAEYEGTTVVRKVWDGAANLVELKVSGPTGSFEGLSLRLYNPESRQWSLHFANKRSGELVAPSRGEFVNGRGVFYSQETFNGRSVFVRFIITPVTKDSCRFEQAFSEDGGKTWETNWIATDTRGKEETVSVYRSKEDTMQKDIEMLSALNAQFIRNFVTGDSAAHDRIIHKNFVCVENSGEVVGREHYMSEWAKGFSSSGYATLSIMDEDIRIFGNMALVRSKTVYTKVVGGRVVRGNSIYTDTYVKENGKWLCVNAQITPLKTPEGDK